ncbi:guanine nucleotide exchange factor [Venturia nashicola]|uniref:Guanine nucleotide exchange factor n=1 Tax=Venturia nashicola TaxID=86259 RepID=A0A4Z1NXQ9_9PEZI|nr:guanine nucleotide exchange factor [Venturia nashicola]
MLSKTGKAKFDDVTALLDKLSTDLKKKTLKTPQRDAILERLKIYGRSVDGSDPIFARTGIQTLSQYAFDSSSTTTSREALRCLANALLLRPETRQLLVDLGYAPKAAEKLKTDNSDDEFLLSRILFLMTYGTTANYQELIKKNRLADNINTCLARHAKRYVKGTRRMSTANPMDDMALTEIAKLVFNITHFSPDLAPSFSYSISPLLQIVQKIKTSQPPLQQPLQACINSLINLDLGDKLSHSALFPKPNPNGITEQLVNILDACVTMYKDSELDQTASPVITLLRKIYKEAPEQVKRHMETLLLPTETDRAKPLGKTNALSSRLLQLSTSASSTTLRTSIQAMLFEISGEDPNKFVANVGYGYASGFLMSQNIPVPQNATDTWTKGGGEGVRINPITGQRLDAESYVDEGPPMTDEEKEIEAEKLFVLFERLRATGMVDVVNPVRQAVEEGRFEELPDDHEDK